MDLFVGSARLFCISIPRPRTFLRPVISVNTVFDPRVQNIQPRVGMPCICGGVYRHTIKYTPTRNIGTFAYYFSLSLSLLFLALLSSFSSASLSFLLVSISLSYPFCISLSLSFIFSSPRFFNCLLCLGVASISGQIAYFRCTSWHRGMCFFVIHPSNHPSIPHCQSLSLLHSFLPFFRFSFHNHIITITPSPFIFTSFASINVNHPYCLLASLPPILP